MIEFRPGKQYNLEQCGQRGIRLMNIYYDTIEKYIPFLLKLGVTHFDDRDATSGPIFGMRDGRAIIRFYMWFDPETIYYSLRGEDGNWLSDTSTNRIEGLYKDEAVLSRCIDGEETAKDEF